MKEIDHHYTQDITCPACGRAYTDSWEFGLGGEEEGQEKCDSCGLEFKWSRFIDVSYSTYKLTGE